MVGKHQREHTERQVRVHDRAECERPKVVSYIRHFVEVKIESRGLSANC